MPTMPQRIKTKIDADAPITAILTGGVHTRPLQRLKTPNAFSPDKVHYNPAAYIPDLRSMFHPQSLAIPFAYQGAVNIALFAEAHDGGKASLSSVRPMLISLLHDWVSDTDEGPKMIFRWSSGLAITDSEEFTGALVCVLTFNVISRWANEP